MTTPEIEGITLQAAPAEASEPKATTKANAAPKKRSRLPILSVAAILCVLDSA